MKIWLENGFITDNSKEIEVGAKFLKTAANAKFIDEAQNLGAEIICVNRAKKLLGIDENIKIVGITGTNGKTTTAAAVYSALLDLGHKCALAGTRGAFVNDKQIAPKSLTTTPILQTLECLKIASQQGCEFFVMEVSSHAIAQRRIEGLNFALKIFTNLSQDHLDYHKTMEEYIAVKSSFFDDESAKLINKDDKFIKFNPKNALTYAIKEMATFGVCAYSLKNGINALLRYGSEEFEINSDLQGEFNLYNLLAAFGAVKMLTNHENLTIAKAIEHFGGVAGRVEKICDNPCVIVDFAHTPDGIDKVLNALKDNEMIVVFGAGGDRDRTKRPIMGKIVAHYAKFAIVTSDNPRFENPDEIIAQICTGMNLGINSSNTDFNATNATNLGNRNTLGDLSQNLGKVNLNSLNLPSNVICQSDRKMAISMALQMAKNGEIVVILGKGDEDYQEICGKKHHFNDKECVLELLSKNIRSGRDEN